MTKYIDKNVVVAEIERRIKEYQSTGDDYWFPVIESLKSILSLLDTLEVREVDLEKAIDDYIYTHDGRKRLALELDWKCCNLTLKGGDEIIKFAKHFFELGLSVNNPITAADRGMAEEITINLKRVAQDYKIDLTKEIEWLGNQVSRITIMDKEKYDFIDHVVHLTLVEEDRLLNEHGGEYSGLEEDGIDSNEYYRIIAERVITILKKNNNYIQEELANIPDKKSPTNEEIGDYDHKAVMESLHPQLKEKAGWLEELEAKLNTLSKEELQRLMQKYEEKCNFKEEPVSEDLEAAIECCGGNKGSGARVRTDFIMR